MDTVGTRLKDTSLDPSSLSYLQTICLKVEDFFFFFKTREFVSFQDILWTTSEILILFLLPNKLEEGADLYLLLVNQFILTEDFISGFF